MSDFEINIRKAAKAVCFYNFNIIIIFFSTHDKFQAFIGIVLIGCHFHYAKAIWKKVAGNGMKTTYFSNIQFTTLIRMAIGLPYCPLDRIKDGEAMKLLKAQANKITDKAANKFSVKFLKYIEKTWINGSYPPENSSQ